MTAVHDVLRVIISSSGALCCLPSVKEQKLDFFSVQCIIKQLLDSVFVIFGIIEVSVRVISLSLRLLLFVTPERYTSRGGGGGTPLYGLYRYVPRDRVWFLEVLDP